MIEVGGFHTTWKVTEMADIVARVVVKVKVFSHQKVQHMQLDGDALPPYLQSNRFVVIRFIACYDFYTDFDPF